MYTYMYDREEGSQQMDVEEKDILDHPVCDEKVN